jgi:hypothetical protein
VVHGSSIHCVYGFDSAAAPTRGLEVGTLRGQTAETLRVGSMHRIPRGNSFIHSLFHLSAPSVTLIARTFKEPGPPQRDYFKPGLSVDYYYREPAQLRAIQSSVCAMRIGGSAANSVLDAAISRMDSLGWFQLCQAISESQPAHLPVALERVALVDSDIAEMFDSVFKWFRRQTALYRLRRRTEDPAQRLAVSFLLNVSDPTLCNDLVVEYFEGNESLAAQALTSVGADFAREMRRPSPLTA